MLAIASIIILFFFCPSAQAGDYLDSAHGSATDGVKRDSVLVPELADYSQGNCAHCHEQHASIGGGEPPPNPPTGPSGFCLFADNFDTAAAPSSYQQDDNMCFYCHTSLSSYQETAFDNYDYSRTFGGATLGMTGIMQTFNQLSYHNLNDVLDLMKDQWPSTFNAGSNPCAGCHNVHIARRNKVNQGDPTYTAISKPSVHDERWGDDTIPNERMSIYNIYQPPYYNSVGSLLEPDGVAADRATQAAKTPDYSAFCTACHTSTNSTISSTPLGGFLRRVDWSTEQHGAGAADHDAYGAGDDMSAPYADGSLGSYVLACTDCHEPHGSPNLLLIRRRINAGAVDFKVLLDDPPGASGPGFLSWQSLCSKCHKTLRHPGPHDVADPVGCAGCHSNCGQCHYHGPGGIF
ncbi:MAG: cytochrome c3 family protein [Desulfobulbaceae bacterium]|nr:cytochrome c3 family protein [Desulfobulbaceae bacterium]